MSKYKQLVKKMTYEEAIEYCRRHPKWVLPKEPIPDGYKDITYWLDSEIIETNIDNVIVKRALTNNGVCHIDFKMNVVVTQREDIDIGTVFYINIDKQIEHKLALYITCFFFRKERINGLINFIKRLEFNFNNLIEEMEKIETIMSDKDIIVLNVVN
jgi:hypothetical protein